MRVLHVTHQYRPALGGAERYITDLSEALAARGHVVDVFTSRSTEYRSWRGDLPRFERLDGVDVYRFAALPRTPLVWRLLEYGLSRYWRDGARRYEPFIFLGNGPVCPGMLWALARRVAGYDLVHINNLHYAHAGTAFSMARWRDVPVVLSPLIHAEQRATYDVGYMRAMLRRADAVLALTRAEKAFLQAQGLSARVEVGGIGVRLASLPPLDRSAARARLGLPRDAFVILFLGRKASYKGLDVGLRAFARLRQRRDDVVFLALGPETPCSRRLWAAWDGVEGLQVRGAVPDDERLAGLAACDVLAMPSTGESFGIVYLEAWAYRRPVIGARVRAVASVIDDGVDGLLIAPGHVGEMEAALATLLEDPARARRMGEAGRAKLARRYTTDRIAALVEALYARVLRHRATTPEA
jgi:glycosyltransferase involved in cell wall biosynthesis